MYLDKLQLFLIDLIVYKMQPWLLLNERQGISMISVVDSYRAISKCIFKACVLTETTIVRI